MARLAHHGGHERSDSAHIYETINEGDCAYRDCHKPRVVDGGDVYDFCITHILRIDRKIGLRTGVVEHLAAATAPSERFPDVQSDGVVYFMLKGDFVKIGFTTDLRRRAGQLKVDRVLAYFPGNFTSEKAAHDAFAQWRSHGEWFHATPECLAYIHRITSTSMAA